MTVFRSLLACVMNLLLTSFLLYYYYNYAIIATINDATFSYEEEMC